MQTISFPVWRGQIIALTGKNGVGKTTLGLILSGLNKESGGTVFLNGKNADFGLAAKRYGTAPTILERNFLPKAFPKKFY